ncbi:MAG: hypothetical protein LUI87_02320 [Lachnospiraceae bacterium]|nr:hypothetical protein [Lachnospiraceae bacterium]
MKMTNEDMRQSIEALATAQETGKLGYAIARNLRKLRDEAKEYLDMRDKLLQKYGTPTKEPGRVLLTSEASKKIEDELAEVKDLESDVDIFTVSEDIFIGGNLKSNQMAVLLWMVTASEKETKKG